MVEYQNFNIGRVNAKYTVAMEKTGMLGIPPDQVNTHSRQIVKDFMRAFGFKFFENGYTGERNFNYARDIFILSTVVKLHGTSLIGEGMSFYQKGIRWGGRKHKKWAPMIATVKNGKTYLIQDNKTFKRLFIITDGNLIFQEDYDLSMTLDKATKL